MGTLKLTSSGTTLVTAEIGGVGSGAQIAIDPATQTTIGTTLTPAGVTVDQGGNVYIADTTSNAVYKSTGGAAPVSFATGFSAPKQLAIDGGGNVYVADAGNNRIAVASSAGVVTSFLATTFQPTTATSTSTLSGPSGVAVDVLGNVYVADTGNNRVVKVAATGATSVLGLSGLNAPRSLAVDAAGDLFIADSGNSRIVEYTAAGIQSTLTLSPSLTTPVGIALDPAGNLYIADAGTQTVSLLNTGSTTPITLATTTNIAAIAADPIGNLYVAGGLTGVLKLNRLSGSIAFANTNVGQTSTQPITVTNTGNSSFTTGASLGTNTDAVDFSINAASTNGCGVNQAILSGGSCGLSAVFMPQSAAALTNTLTFPTYGVVNTASVGMSGTGVLGTVGTTTGISTTPIVYGQTASVQVKVTPNTGSANPIGSVTLTIDSSTTQMGTLSGGTYTFMLSGLGAGSHSLSASFTAGSGFTNSATASNTLLSVSKAPLSVTASCANRLFDQLDVCAAAISGYQYTDTAGTVIASGSAGYSIVSTPISTQGTYTATAVTSGLNLTTMGSQNYRFVAVNTTYSIQGGVPQRIIFTQLPNLAPGSSYQLTARTTSGLPVTYSVVGPASVAGTTLTVTGAGTVMVTANSSPDSTGDYAAASSATVTFTAP